MYKPVTLSLISDITQLCAKMGFIVNHKVYYEITTCDHKACTWSQVQVVVTLKWLSLVCGVPIICLIY